MQNVVSVICVYHHHLHMSVLQNLKQQRSRREQFSQPPVSSSPMMVNNFSKPTPHPASCLQSSLWFSPGSQSNANNHCAANRSTQHAVVAFEGVFTLFCVLFCFSSLGKTSSQLQLSNKPDTAQTGVPADEVFDCYLLFSLWLSL